MTGTRDRLLLLAAFWGAAVLMPTPAAHASIGAGIGASPIELASAGLPGHSYQLPEAYVLNTGSEPARYRIHVERLSTGSGHTVPLGWVVPARNDFLLAPHKSALVPLRLKLPGNARSGRYLSDVVAAAGPPRPVRGTALGAAAATKLIFQVADPGSRLPGWLIIALIALAAAIAIRFAIRGSPLRIHLERGPTT